MLSTWAGVTHPLKLSANGWQAGNCGLPVLVRPGGVLIDSDKCTEPKLALLDLDGGVLALLVLATSASILGHL